MSIFLLPKIIHNICNDGVNENNICFKMTKEIPDILISHSLYNSLCEVKIQIENNDIAWDNSKKITNPYEFIHTIIPGYKTQVSKMAPLSRSFYKMIEISTIFNLHYKSEEINNNNDGNVLNNVNMNSILLDYTHNISSTQSLHHVKDIEWCVHDNYYYDPHSGINNSNNHNYRYNNDYKNDENNIDGSNIDSSSNNNSQNAFRMVKNKNIFHLIEKVNENEKVDSNEKVVDSNETIFVNDAKNNFKSFHLAEGPGGFIEAVVHLRKNKNDKYYGMTLISSDSKCPGWKKSKRFLEDNPNVIIEKGIDETGNLLSSENFIHCNRRWRNRFFG
jgi:hypothetical protein